MVIFDKLNFCNLLPIENHNKCPVSYKKWQTFCGANIRTKQMLNRQVWRRDRRLYTQDDLNKYNQAKQKQAKDSWHALSDQSVPQHLP